MPALVREGEGKPQGPCANFDALAFVQGMELDDWEETGLRNVCHYLRGGTSLVCPDDWKKVIPDVL